MPKFEDEIRILPVSSSISAYFEDENAIIGWDHHRQSPSQGLACCGARRRTSPSSGTSSDKTPSGPVSFPKTGDLTTLMAAPGYRTPRHMPNLPSGMSADKEVSTHFSNVLYVKSFFPKKPSNPIITLTKRSKSRPCPGPLFWWHLRLSVWQGASRWHRGLCQWFPQISNRIVGAIFEL